MSTGIVVFAHGSRIESANEAVRSVTRTMAEAAGLQNVVPAFLDLGTPDLKGAVRELVEAGVKRVLIVPYFLTLGTHLERDLPRIVSNLARIHRGVEFSVTPPLDGHPALVQVLLDRAQEALREQGTAP